MFRSYCTPLCSVIMSGNDLESLIQSVNSALCLLNTWLKAYKLSLNVNKTYDLVFHRARIKVNNDNSIQMKEYNKYCISLKIPRCYIDSNKNCLSNLYHTYIFPYLIYCIEVWGNASHCHLLPLFLTQKKIIRLITFSKHLAHKEPIFKSLNILPLNSLYYHITGLLMYTLSNRLLPEALNELYIKKNKVHHYPTRNCDKYHIQTSTDSFSNVSARIWNVITTNIDVNISLMQFNILPLSGSYWATI